MRKAKRILACMLAVMMLATCMVPVVFADETTAVTDKQNKFSDVNANAVYVPAVKTLNLMGVINGYPDGTFGPDRNVTRAEFTAMLMRILNLGGIGSASAEALPFTDVDASDSGISWAIPDINTAYAKGIINGYEDKTFRPNANVSYEEALKMIVCTLGYTLDVSGTPWYAEYVGQAGKLGITDVAYSLGKVETPASRACIAQMLYDSLEVNLVENQEVTKKTILTDYLRYTKGRGVISANGVASISAPDVLLRDNEVQIMGLNEKTGVYSVSTYRTVDTEIKNYLGHEIEYYYKDNGTAIRDLALYVLQNSSELTIHAEAIERSASNSSQIRYYSSDSRGKTLTANLADDSIVLYNGKLYGLTPAASRFNSATMIPQVGSMKLLDSDMDGKYDIINVEDYEVYFVSSKIATEYAIVDDVTKTGEAKKLVLDMNDNSKQTVIVNASGATMDYNGIGVNSVVCVMESNANGGRPLRKVVVVNDTVSGTVTSVEAGESVTVGSTEYQYSKAAPWMTGIVGGLTEPQLQESGVYYKDINGDIVAYKKNATVENINYGYIMGMQSASSVFDDYKEVRILTQNGSYLDVMLTNGVRINNSNGLTVAEAENELKTAARLQNTDANENCDVQQVIKYSIKTTSDGTVLDKIYTVTSQTSNNKGAAVESDKLSYLTSVNGKTEMTYGSASRKLTASGATIDVGSAIVFAVPNNRNSLDDYSKKSASDIFRNNSKYFVEAFDVSATNSAKVVVCYGASAATSVDGTTPIYVLSKNTERATNTNNDQVMTRLISYVSNDRTALAEKEAWLSPTSPVIPQLGDVYRPGADKDGFASIETKDLLYRVGGGNEYFKASHNGSDFYTAEFACVVGSVVAIDGEGFAVLDKKVAAGTPANQVDLSSTMNFKFGSFGNARVIRYNKTGAEPVVEDLTADKDGVLKSLVAYDANDTAGVITPSKVMIQLSYGAIKMIYILD